MPKSTSYTNWLTLHTISDNIHCCHYFICRPVMGRFRPPAVVVVYNLLLIMFCCYHCIPPVYKPISTTAKYEIVTALYAKRLPEGIINCYCWQTSKFNVLLLTFHNICVETLFALITNIVISRCKVLLRLPVAICCRVTNLLF